MEGTVAADPRLGKIKNGHVIYVYVRESGWDV
jgi:hypothetical protein